MVDIQRVGTYFFILGALIAILSGAFQVTLEMETITLLLLIITGAFVGLLNVEEERELHFLLATGVFIVSTTAIQDYLTGLELLNNFEEMLRNFIIFTASAGVVVGLKLVFKYGSSYEGLDQDDDEPVEFQDPKKESFWNTVIFAAVCAAFVIFILEVFFYTNGLTPVLQYLSYVIIAVFVIDLVILITRAKGVWPFLKHHWPDIISVVPLTGVFQLAKVARVARIARIARLMRTGKMTKMSKISHSAKFFSKQSGFNKYLKKK